MIPLNVDVPMKRLPWTGEIPGWATVLLYLAFDLWGAIFDRNSNTGYVGHLVGGVAGIALAIMLLKGGWLSPDLGEQTLLQWLSGEGPVEPDTDPRRKRSEPARAVSEKQR